MTLQVGSLIPLTVNHVDSNGNVEVGLTNNGFQSAREEGNGMKIQGNTSGSKGEGSMKQTGLPSTVSSSGLLLNTMKTGMKLEGVVASCTPYAAFVNVGVVRSGRGGRYIEVNGMLHRDDMHSDVTVMSNNRKRLTSDELADQGMVGKGLKMTVYVKEVYKNSGRFTLTMDPTIEKQQIIDMRQQIKVEGNERRRARRMRRILDEVNEGDTVTGVVSEVINEGVLVSISNLGSLNITGLMSKRDLPKQFQVPPDLKDTFQNQLLGQDFSVGREVSCGVVKINQKSNSRMKYNLKLVFEDFGSRGVLTDMETEVPDEALEMLNEGELQDFEADYHDMQQEELEELQDVDTLSVGLDDGHGNAVDPLDYSAGDLEEVWENSDMREIYQELCEGEAMLKATNLYAWGDIQDMIQNAEVSTGQVKHAIEEAIHMPIPSDLESLKLSFEQFAEIVAVIQDFLDENATKDLKSAGAHAKQSKEDIAEFGRIPVSMMGSMESAQAMMTPSMLLDGDASTSSSSTALSGNKDAEGGLEQFDEASLDSLEDDAVEEVAREVYDELRGDNDVVTIDNLLNWGDIQEMLSAGHLSRGDLDKAFTHVLKGDSVVSFEQFFQLVNVLEDLANPADDEDDSGSGSGSSGEPTMEADGEDYDEIDEEAETEMLTDIYKVRTQVSLSYSLLLSYL
jgi:DNA-directed RNA polymerase subunit E'/Rpb7